MAPYQKTNAFAALAFASAMAQRPSFKRACRAKAAEQRRLVGLGRLELPTSRLSSARSNQLSYKPLTLIFPSMLIREVRIGVLLAAIGQAKSTKRNRPSAG